MTRAEVGRIALLAWFLALWIIAAVVCLSGCLTSTKIHRWETALLGWARNGSPACVDAVQAASKYLKAANDRLNNPANRAEDIESDGEAKKLMQEAAQKCGEMVP